MTKELTELCEQIALDAAKAIPAAMVVAVFGTLAKPRLQHKSLLSKAVAFVGCVATGVMVGQIAREFDQARQFASALVILCTLLAQDVVMTAMARGRRYIKHFDPSGKPDDPNETHRNDPH